MPDNEEKLTLANMKGGAAFEMVDMAIAHALENINDINTTLKKREVILKITLQPSEDRTIVGFDLAPYLFPMVANGNLMPLTISRHGYNYSCRRLRSLLNFCG